MKKFLILLPSAVAHAETVSLDFQAVPVRDLVRLVYGDLLKRSFVVDGSVQDDLKPVDLYLKGVPVDQVESVLVELLKSQGVSVDTRAGLTIVRKADEWAGERKEAFFYRPKYRSVAYFQDVLTALFPAGSFASQRGASIPFSAVTGASVSPSRQSGVMAASGGSAGQNHQQGVNKLTDADVDVLMFNGAAADIERLQGMLTRLDVPTGEVLVKAVVYEVKTTKKEGSAIDLALSILGGKVSLAFAAGAADASSLSAKLLSGANSLQAVFSALSSDDRFRSVSSPRVRVRSGTSARLTVGDETPVLGSVSYDGEGRPIQSVNYKSSGVIFDLKPQVRAEGIDLHVAQQISSFITTTTGVSGSPTLTKRELETDLTLQSGDLVFIGGLELDSTTQSNAGLSFFPAFLRADQSDEVKSEIILMQHVERI